MLEKPVKTVKDKINVFWFRRDLRLNDNCGLFNALSSAIPVLPLFIFDTDILNKLDDKKDKRVEFIHNALEEIQTELLKVGSSLLIKHGTPIKVFKQLTELYSIVEVFINHDYEPDAIKRDDEIKKFLNTKGIKFNSYKDQVIFEKREIVKDNGKPYTVYTPYRNKWKAKLQKSDYKPFKSETLTDNFYKIRPFKLPSLKEIGFEKTGSTFPPKEIRKSIIKNYRNTRDFPAIDGTSHLSVHLRFGTVSIRELVKEALKLNEKWLDELIWREFYMMILFYFPHVVTKSFRPAYDNIKWRNNEEEFRHGVKAKQDTRLLMPE